MESAAILAISSAPKADILRELATGQQGDVDDAGTGGTWSCSDRLLLLLQHANWQQALLVDHGSGWECCLMIVICCCCGQHEFGPVRVMSGICWNCGLSDEVDLRDLPEALQLVFRCLSLGEGLKDLIWIGAKELGGHRSELKRESWKDTTKSIWVCKEQHSSGAKRFYTKVVVLLQVQKLGTSALAVLLRGWAVSPLGNQVAFQAVTQRNWLVFFANTVKKCNNQTFSNIPTTSFKTTELKAVPIPNGFEHEFFLPSLF